MKLVKKIGAGILCALFAFTACYSFTGCGDKNASELTTVRVCEVTHSLFYAPQYVAIEKGFFEEEGISVDLSNGGGADKVMAAVLSNNMDIGLAGPEACIYVYNEGNDDWPMVFAQLTKRDGSFLVSREPVDSFSWSDLEGKTVIPGRRGGVPYMTLEYTMKQNGLNPSSDVTLDDSIQFDLMASAFSNGSADYVTLFEPTAAAVVKSGKGYYATSIGSQSGEIPYTAYFSKQSYSRKHPEILQGFTNAIARGQVWIAEHSAREIAEAIQNQFPDTDIDTLTEGVQSYKNIDAWNDSPVMKEEAFQKLQTVMIEAGELKQTVPFDKIVTNSYAEAVK